MKYIFNTDDVEYIKFLCTHHAQMRFFWLNGKAVDEDLGIGPDKIEDYIKKNELTGKQITVTGARDSSSLLGILPAKVPENVLVEAETKLMPQEFLRWLEKNGAVLDRVLNEAKEKFTIQEFFHVLEKNGAVLDSTLTEAKKKLTIPEFVNVLRMKVKEKVNVHKLLQSLVKWKADLTPDQFLSLCKQRIEVFNNKKEKLAIQNFFIMLSETTIKEADSKDDDLYPSHTEQVIANRKKIVDSILTNLVEKRKKFSPGQFSDVLWEYTKIADDVSVESKATLTAQEFLDKFKKFILAFETNKEQITDMIESFTGAESNSKDGTPIADFKSLSEHQAHLIVSELSNLKGAVHIRSAKSILFIILHRDQIVAYRLTYETEPCKILTIPLAFNLEQGFILDDKGGDIIVSALQESLFNPWKKASPRPIAIIPHYSSLATNAIPTGSVNSYRSPTDGRMLNTQNYLELKGFSPPQKPPTKTPPTGTRNSESSPGFFTTPVAQKKKLAKATNKSSTENSASCIIS